MAKLQQVETEVKNGGPSTKAEAPASGMIGTAGIAGVTPCLPPSFAEACQFVSAPYSCLVLDTSRRHVALSPMFLKKKKTGIQEQLNCELLKYSERRVSFPKLFAKQAANRTSAGLQNVTVAARRCGVFKDETICNVFNHMGKNIEFPPVLNIWRVMLV